MPRDSNDVVCGLAMAMGGQLMVAIGLVMTMVISVKD